MSDSFYKAHVFMCTNERPEGHKRGSCGCVASPLRKYMKVRLKELGVEQSRVNSAGCLDRCELGPVMVIYPEGVWYKYTCKEDIDLIIEQHILGGNVVTSLKIENEETGK